LVPGEEKERMQEWEDKKRRGYRQDRREGKAHEKEKSEKKQTRRNRLYIFSLHRLFSVFHHAGKIHKSHFLFCEKNVNSHNGSAGATWRIIGIVSETVYIIGKR